MSAVKLKFPELIGWSGIGNKSIAFLILVFIFFGFSLQAQEFGDYKTEKVTPEDFHIESDLIDETSQAVYLYDIGISDIIYAIRESPEIRTKRKYRMKILNEEGLQNGTLTIPLFVGYGMSQAFISATGGVYDLVNGEVHFEKLTRSNWSVNSISESRDIVNISFQSVSVGSIIELEYVIVDPFYFEPDDWIFQYDDIPVLHSEFTFVYPEVMQYSLLKFGVHPLACEPIFTNGLIPGEPTITQNTYDKKSYCFISKDIPGMREEPLMDSMENYRSKITFELSTFNVIGGKKLGYNSSWDDIAQEILTRTNVQRFVNSKISSDYFYSDRNAQDLWDSVGQIYYQIQSELKIEKGLNYLTPHVELLKILKGERVSQSDINWVLLSALLGNRIEAYPVMYATRSHPRIHKEFPLSAQFSHMMVAVAHDSGYWLFDLSDKEFEAGEIAQSSMNGDGLVLKENYSDWIPMTSKFSSNQRAVFEFTSLEHGVLKGEMKLKIEGKYAHDFKQRLALLPQITIQNLFPVDENIELTLETKNIAEMKQPLELEFSVSYRLQKVGDSYLLPAVLYDAKKVNPLSDKTRHYPVNFPEPWMESYTCLLHLDPGKYEIAMPNNENLVLPKHGGKFFFSTTESLGNLIVRSKIEINTTMFESTRYSELKKLNQAIMRAHSSMIKITEI